ncbi:MAG: hypothetical protein KAT00_13905 [Planctomycetes bacterium]|nr:hypothetical protein [Planctomycetota bacterium]
MGVSGLRKAAMLLTNLDSVTASELLKGQPPEVVQKVAMELSQLDATGQGQSDEAAGAMKEFCTVLSQPQSGTIHVQSFVSNMLKGTTGSDQALKLQEDMQKAIRDKDPFIGLTSASPAQIAIALEGEPAQAIAVVLSSLPAKLSTEVLARLNEEASLKVVWKMTRPSELSGRTTRRIGEMVCKRLMELTEEQHGPIEEIPPEQTLRNVAIVLSGLDKDKRDTLLDEIEGNDEETGKTVKALMVTWEDIIKIEDRSLQEALRKVDAGILAKALHGADLMVTTKIRSNISERMSEMVDEEVSLMSEPRKKDISAAREEVAKPLREANEAEELLFIEDD